LGNEIDLAVKRGKRVALILAACVTVALLAAVFWPGEKEPAYQGKKLGEWIFLYMSHNDPEEMQMATNAVRQIGTNGLPWLIKSATFQPSKFREFVGSLPRPFRRWAGLDDARFRRVEAFQGFRILGTLARPALPQLTAWANDRSSPHRPDAMLILGETGEFALVPDHVRALNYPDPRLRVQATNELLRIAPEMLTNGLAKSY
jgi:hypothetical protein